MGSMDSPPVTPAVRPLFRARAALRHDGRKARTAPTGRGVVGLACCAGGPSALPLSLLALWFGYYSGLAVALFSRWTREWGALVADRGPLGGSVDDDGLAERAGSREPSGRVASDAGLAADDADDSLSGPTGTDARSAGGRPRQTTPALAVLDGRGFCERFCRADSIRRAVKSAHFSRTSGSWRNAMERILRSWRTDGSR